MFQARPVDGSRPAGEWFAVLPANMHDEQKQFLVAHAPVAGTPEAQPSDGASGAAGRNGYRRGPAACRTEMRAVAIADAIDDARGSASRNAVRSSSA